MVTSGETDPFPNKMGSHVSDAHHYDVWSGSREILLSWLILDTENPLCFMKQQPKISNIHCLRPLLLYTIIYSAHCSVIVAMDGDGRLKMSQFTQGESHNFCVDGLEEECAKFCFGHGCGDHF